MQRLAKFALLASLSACVTEMGDDSVATDLEETSEVSLEATVPSTITTLANEQRIWISGAANSVRYFKIEVPANFDRVYTNRTGDGIQTPTTQGAHLYMKRGALPTTTSYDCRRLDGSNNACNVDRPLAGTYYIMVLGAATRGYNMELWARYFNMYSPMTNNYSYFESRGIGNDATYKLQVPSGMESVTFRMSLNGEQTGEAEVYVKINGFASETNYDCMFGIGYNYFQGAGECRFANNPIGGTYYVKVKTIRRYEATLSGRYRFPLAGGGTGTVAN